MEPAYLALAHREPHPLLLELEQHARHEDFPLIARETGRLLSTLVHAMQANRVLEIGTGFGYATLWIALALPPAGRLWTAEPNIERSDVARKYISRSERFDSVDMLAQTGREVLATFPTRQLDIIFIGGQMQDYAYYLEACIPLLKPSGLVIFDHLLQPEPLKAFHQTFLHHPLLDATILPIGDGIGLGSRLA
jgi:predicted O-methyltransferase YrrM